MRHITVQCDFPNEHVFAVERLTYVTLQRDDGSEVWLCKACYDRELGRVMS